MSDMTKVIEYRLQQIDDRQTRIEQKLDGRLQRSEDEIRELQINECSRAVTYTRIDEINKTIFGRLLALELQQAESKGRLVITMLIIGVALATVTTWIGKHI